MSIESRRIALGWSREHLAAQAGLTSQTVWSVERQPSRPKRVETLAKIEAALAAGEAATTGRDDPTSTTSPTIAQRVARLEARVDSLEAAVAATRRLDVVLEMLAEVERRTIRAATEPADPPTPPQRLPGAPRPRSSRQ